MNVLQITNTVCTDTNQMTGVNRVAKQLSEFWANFFHDQNYQAYFCEDEGMSPLFKASFRLSNPLNADAFEFFLQEKEIDAILYNFAGNHMIKVLPDICRIARKHNIRVVYCLHFMPGYEGCSYGSFEEFQYSIISRKAVLDKLKKWMISLSKPFSTKLIQRGLKRKYEPAYLECDKVVVFSEPYIDEYLHIERGHNRGKFAVIPNPLSFSEFLPASEMKNKKKEVIVVGRLVEAQKRVSAALKVWRLVEQNPLLNEWTLSIVGGGKDEPFYRWLAEKYQLKRISFEGRQDPKPYYKRASIMMSTSAYEGWPMVMMEAMPMGCCCLGFDSYDAIHDIIEDGVNGRIIPDNDIKGYYQALSDLMQDENKRIAIGKSTIESSKRFSMDIIGKKWRDVLVG